MLQGNWYVNSVYVETEVSSWSNLVKILETSFLDWPEFIYRGQSDSEWPLRSKFDREYKNICTEIVNFNSTPLTSFKGEAVIPERSNILDTHLQNFKLRSVGRRGLNPAKLSTLEWWGMGQHFGLATPLLDWSLSPYVSLFFSLCNTNQPKSGFHALWAFTPRSFHDLHSNQNPEIQSEDLSIRFIQEALCDENHRIVSQRGVFTQTPNGEDIEEFIDKSIELKGFAPVLYKINIPSRYRDDFLRHLDAMNINAATLFPDMTGVAELTNRELEKIKTTLLRERSNEFTERLLADNLCH
ncbi:FRG domain-containing protein [Vibrio splendidus]|jgi:hypothetical protein